MKPSTKHLITALHDLLLETQETLKKAPLDTLDVEEISLTGVNLYVIEDLVKVISDNEEIYYG